MAALRRQGLFQEAAEYLAEHGLKGGDVPQTLTTIATLFCGAGDAEQACLYFKKAHAAANGRIPMSWLNDLVRLLHQTGRKEQVEKYVQQTLPAISLDKATQQIFVVAMPKSAGSSLCGNLAKATGWQVVASGHEDAGIPGYSASLLDGSIAAALRPIPLVHQCHAMPWANNLEIIRQHSKDLLVVHLRDPRHAILSYFYMAEKYDSHRLRLLTLEPKYNYFDLRTKFRLIIENVFPTFIEWLVGWVAIADAQPSKVFLSTFDKYSVDERGVIEEITAFISGAGTAPETLVKRMVNENRPRGVDPLLSSEVFNHLGQQIPVNLRRRFGW